MVSSGPTGARLGGTAWSSGNRRRGRRQHRLASGLVSQHRRGGPVPGRLRRAGGGDGDDLIPGAPTVATRAVASPVTGRWLAVNSPATRVPSHSLHSLGQTFAIDLVYEPKQGARPAPMAYSSSGSGSSSAGSCRSLDEGGNVRSNSTLKASAGFFPAPIAKSLPSGLWISMMHGGSGSSTNLHRRPLAHALLEGRAA